MAERKFYGVSVPTPHKMENLTLTPNFEQKKTIPTPNFRPFPKLATPLKPYPLPKISNRLNLILNRNRI